MNITDIRPSCKEVCSPCMSGYWELCEGRICREDAQNLLPDRNTLGTVWRYLAGCGQETVQEGPMCLCRKIVRWSGAPLSLGQMMTCLDIFADVQLIELQRYHKYITIRLLPRLDKADLTVSRTMQRLMAAKES